VLIDTRQPPPEPGERPVWEPDWRLCAWLAAAIASFVGCSLSTGFTAYVLICVGVTCAAQALSRVLPNPFGMHEHRQ
jgi:hypothetical protein